MSELLSALFGEIDVDLAVLEAQVLSLVYACEVWLVPVFEASALILALSAAWLIGEIRGDCSAP